MVLDSLGYRPAIVVTIPDCTKCFFKVMATIKIDFLMEKCVSFQLTSSVILTTASARAEKQGAANLGEP